MRNNDCRICGLSVKAGQGSAPRWRGTPKWGKGLCVTCCQSVARFRTQDSGSLERLLRESLLRSRRLRFAMMGEL